MFKYKGDRIPSSEREKEEDKSPSARGLNKSVRIQEDEGVIEPEIPNQVLKDLVLDNKMALSDDRKLFMMFCGVDCLEKINDIALTQEELEEAEKKLNKDFYKSAVKYLHSKDKPRKTVVKKEPDPFYKTLKYVDPKDLL